MNVSKGAAEQFPQGMSFQHLSRIALFNSALFIVFAAERAGQAGVAQLAKAARDGDLSARIAPGDKQGLVHDLGERLNSFNPFIDGAVDECASILRAIADGDHRHSLAECYRGARHRDRLRRSPRCRDRGGRRAAATASPH